MIARLEQADPVRLAMALLAPAAARGRLLSLYALNDALAQTALAAREPLAAQMRVRWWVDQLSALDRNAPPPHDLLGALWTAWGPQAAALAPLAEARMHDAAREPFASIAAVQEYADATGGALMTAAAGVLGVPPSAALRAQGRGAALTAWLRARPALQGLGLGLSDPGPESLQALAGCARQAFAEAAALRRTVPRAAAPVLFAGVGVRGALAAAEQGRDAPPPSDFARRAALARLALTGRWWI